MTLFLCIYIYLFLFVVKVSFHTTDDEQIQKWQQEPLQGRTPVNAQHAHCNWFRWREQYSSEESYWIRRVYTMSPKYIETFALKLLLVNVPSPKSFTDLWTVNGNIYKTFKVAVIDRNLFESDSQFEVAIEEAASHQMTKQLQAIFAYLCAFCNLKDPFNLSK